MALERMKLVNVIGLMSYLDDVAAALGQTGVFQPDETAEFYSDNENMIPVNASNEFEPLLEKLRELMNGAGIRPKIVDLPEEKDLGFEEANRFAPPCEKSVDDMRSICALFVDPTSEFSS